uniref:Ig-like domain-containing protein n=1 Tax=Anopheles stephensi TaxID=30069 RepID=A0A182YE08_ANOST
MVPGPRPKRKLYPSILQHLNEAPEVSIVDEEGAPLYDKYYEVGSTIKLMCKIRHISMLRSVVYWIHNENILNHDTTRGGIR